MMYKDLNIPLIEFVKVIETGDTSTIENWQSLYMQYLEALGDKNISIIVTRSAEIEQLENKIRIGEAIINIFDITKSYNTAKLLEEFGYSVGIVLNESNADAYVKSVHGYLKSEKFRVKELLESIKLPEGDKVTLNLQFFQGMIVKFEIAFKKDIDIDKLKLSKYCEYYKQYVLYIESENKKNSNDII